MLPCRNCINQNTLLANPTLIMRFNHTGRSGVRWEWHKVKMIQQGKHLCHSLEVKFGENCTTSPTTRKLILYPNKLLMYMLILDNLVPRQSQGSKSKPAEVQRSSPADKGWHHRAMHEWVTGYSIPRNDSWLTKWASSGHIPSSDRANKTKTPNCISHDRGNNKLIQSRLSLCIQNHSKWQCR